MGTPSDSAGWLELIRAGMPPLWWALAEGSGGAVWTGDDGGDAEIAWVATLPEARGRGISKQLMARAIIAAGERGRLTTTLVATKLGRPVYERIGYRDFGAIQMWERRKAG